MSDVSVLMDKKKQQEQMSVELYKKTVNKIEKKITKLTNSKEEWISFIDEKIAFLQEQLSFYEGQDYQQKLVGELNKEPNVAITLEDLKPSKPPKGPKGPKPPKGDKPPKGPKPPSEPIPDVPVDDPVEAEEDQVEEVVDEVAEEPIVEDPIVDEPAVEEAQEEISGKEANKPPSWIDARKTYYRLKNNREIFPAETPKYLKDKGFNEEGMLTALTLIGLGFINLEGVVYLIIPVMKYGEVYGGQLINMTSGEKRYLKGTNKEGGYYELSNFGGTAKPAFEGMTVKIGEGFATCYSVLKISLPGQRVLMAFDKGNMRKVGARLQESKIIYIEDV